jgi:hypothetical protein
MNHDTKQAVITRKNSCGKDVKNRWAISAQTLNTRFNKTTEKQNKTLISKTYKKTKLN